MRLSNRIQGLTGGGSDGWEVYYKQLQMVAAGEKIIALSIGEPDVKTDPAILDEMHRAARAGATGYSSIPGMLPLRKAIAERVAARTGVPTGPENVQVMPGGQLSLFGCLHATCDEGDKALICDPYYATYPGTVRAIGAVPVSVPSRPEDLFRPRPEVIDGLAEGAKALVINSPNNPTGGIYDRETLEGIAEVCKRRDLWLISDEVYDTQCWNGEIISPRTLPGMAERTLVIGSFSKSHAMTGSRIGWVVGPPEVADHIRQLATHMTFGVPGFLQEAALFALRQGPDFEAKVAEPFRRRRDIALRLLEEQNVVKAIPPQGAMYIMLDIRATGMSGRDFAMALLEQEKIGVMPGESFGASAAGHLRVALTVDDDSFTEAMERLLAFAGRMT